MGNERAEKNALRRPIETTLTRSMIRRVEGRDTGEHLVQHGTGGVNVNFVRVRLAEQDLGCQVLRRSAEGHGRLAVIEEPIRRRRCRGAPSGRLKPMRARRQTTGLRAWRLWTVAKVFRQAKVGEDAVTRCRDEHVLWLQVAVGGTWWGERGQSRLEGLP